MGSGVLGILRSGVGMVILGTGVMGVVILGTRVMDVVTLGTGVMGVVIMDVLTHISIHMVGIPTGMDGDGLILILPPPILLHLLLLLILHLLHLLHLLIPLTRPQEAN